MTGPTLDVEALYTAIDRQRRGNQMQFREVAAEAGVSPSTLTRIGHGRGPNADGLVRLLAWLGDLDLTAYVRPAEQGGTDFTPFAGESLSLAQETFTAQAQALKPETFRQDLPHHRYAPDRGICCGRCAETAGVMGPHPRWWTCGTCKSQAPIDDFDLIPGMAADADAVECPKSTRADGKLHSWHFDGDDPRIICVFCGQMRDALNGAVLREGDRG